MTSTTTITPRTLTASDLEAAGLTDEQIARLTATRERYSPFHEFFDEREFQQLSFLRWCIDNGRLDISLDC